MEAGKQDAPYLLAEFVGVSLDIRQQRVEIDQALSLQALQILYLMPFQRINQQECIRIDRQVGFCPLRVCEICLGTRARLDDL